MGGNERITNELVELDSLEVTLNNLSTVAVLATLQYEGRVSNSNSNLDGLNSDQYGMEQTERTIDPPPTKSELNERERTELRLFSPFLTFHSLILGHIMHILITYKLITDLLLGDIHTWTYIK